MLKTLVNNLFLERKAYNMLDPIKYIRQAPQQLEFYPSA